MHINKELYKKTKYDTQRLITAKKKAFFDEKLSENFEILKELWNNLNSLGMPMKTIVSCFQSKKLY